MTDENKKELEKYLTDKVSGITGCLESSIFVLKNCSSVDDIAFLSTVNSIEVYTDELKKLKKLLDNLN